MWARFVSLGQTKSIITAIKKYLRGNDPSYRNEEAQRVV